MDPLVARHYKRSTTQCIAAHSAVSSVSERAPPTFVCLRSHACTYFNTTIEGDDEEHAFTKVPEKSPRRAVSQAKCMNSPDHDPDDGLRSRAVRSGRYTVRDWGEKREGSAVPSGKKGAAADAAVWDSDRFCVSARGPLRSRELTPCYARATSCGSRRSCRRGYDDTPEPLISMLGGGGGGYLSTQLYLLPSTHA